MQKNKSIKKSENLGFTEFPRPLHFKNEVSIFLPDLKGRDTTKIEKQENKGRSPPWKTIKQTRFIQP